MSLDQFARAAGFLADHDIALRVFLLVHPPFVDPAEARPWLERSIVFAFDCGASVVALIPTRTGNGALDSLRATGELLPPKLETLEQALDYGVGLKRGRVFADLWDLARFSECASCFDARLARLAQISHSGDPCSRSVWLLRRRIVNRSCDVAVIGSGFAGSLCAMIAHRLGHDVVVLERGRHPRFAIGESSTPLANLLLESLATRYALPQLLPFSKWGSWQRTHPEVACGLKRGFTFIHHTLRAASANLSDRGQQLLVAASPRDEIADTHWYRADFDAFFARTAQEVGVTPRHSKARLL